MKKICFGILLLILSGDAFAKNIAYLCADPDFKKGHEYREVALRKLIADRSVDAIQICWAQIGLTEPLWINRPLEIMGVGENTRIYAKTKFADNAAMIKFTHNAGGSKVYNMLIDGRSRAAKGIEAIGLNGFTVERASIRNFLGTNFKNGSVGHYTEIYPARAIQIKNSGNIDILFNTIENIGGYDTSADKYFNGTSLVGKIHLAHRGIVIYGSFIGSVNVTGNTINNVFGYLDADAIHLQDIHCNTACYPGVVSNNTINNFGKRAIKIQTGNTTVNRNKITSSGLSDSVNNKTIGTTGAAISSYCLIYPCEGNVISNNTIDLQRAFRGIQARGPHFIGNNQVTIRSSHKTGRGHPTYEFSMQLYGGMTHFASNRIVGSAKNPHFGTTNYADGYCVKSVPLTDIGDIKYDCDARLPASVIIR
ncbi:hypothetical protein [Pseudoalteromonas sp. Of7M-16]|uniref:hypothetical protein n=1 Tax=Pseudoalteromonas sp. Of7M-16 TaxID=2917756 RepID=UPI001EF495FF|nr:hypothetical protein [Pseudoalteromonas sp. Of7M-16]MCG7551518.1 hypothetical protein [Pseudoalteromonas sp. Of7M-16]